MHRAGQRPIAVGAASSRVTAANHRVQSPSHHLGGLIACEVGNYSLHRRAHLIEHRIGRGFHHADPEKVEGFDGAGNVAEVARQPRQVLDDEDRELLAVRRVHHGLEAVAEVHGAAALGVVGEAVLRWNEVAVTFGPAFRERKLVVDG